MPKRLKERCSLEDILASCSDTLFPAEMGNAKVSINSRDCDGDTPLHVMLWRNDTYAALELIRSGADIDAVGDMSETPLHVALRKQNVAVIQALLDAGADVSLVSEFGQSPASLAAGLKGQIKRLFENL
ncbi:ankyrin repeat domain-containing protein [Pseudaestuariivita rosea]|uniref:ankyrin repeat domain-containing protein n=1 Tax=Pseudaestuariivita rosea TaxID=2763263 RepID=UPI001ABAD5F0|nr:ankyrin repeat domain-containing protein [Pseudaestuariivita rosea]